MSRRRKRDTVQNIYNTCKIWGNCPDDVINKVESSTIADKILKYGSGLVYFGNAGIGTGSGGGGRLGYLPLGNRPAGRPAVPFSRPTTRVTTRVPPIVETVVPDSIAGNVVDAGGPSVIDLTDLTTESTGVDVHPDVEPGVLEPGPTEPPSIDVTSDTSPTIQVTESIHSNPTFEIPVVNGSTYPTEAVDINTVSTVSTIIGTEESAPLYIPETIELQTFNTQRTANNTFSETIIDDTGFDSSTPLGKRPPEGRLGGARVSVYNKRYAQVEVENPAFIRDPYTLVQYSNVSYDPEDTVTFNRGSGDVNTAPDPAFQDVLKLSKPYTTRSPGGHVRLGRVGQRAGVKTRSGLQIGPQVHYFTRISSIDPGETIELEVLGDPNTPDVLVGDDEFDIVSLTESLADSYSESDLLDVLEDIGENLQLVMGGRRRGPSVPVFTPRGYPPIESITVNFPGSGITIDESTAQSDDEVPIEPDIPSTPSTPIRPGLDVYDSIDFYLHPSLGKKLRKKRKRRFY
ncbi:L2 [Bovine papillomavirus]|uniref:Minor capsid protein L2 n=1 Tax=Bovine papillomavirus TaxID=10571 RepID=A0A1Z3FWK6_9PAPI|nr:L2 [Bovine papillomavirus]ASC49552.1 L2 [Bovine papillomavirus]